VLLLFIIVDLRICSEDRQHFNIHPLDLILWTSILEDGKLSGVLGASSWFIWIHEKLNLIHSELSASGLSTLSIFFTLEIKGRGGVLAQRRR
jgi:hypothetical protein